MHCTLRRLKETDSAKNSPEIKSSVNNFTRHDFGLHRVNQAKLLATKKGLRLVNVIGDGAFIFRAIGYAMSAWC